MSSDFDFNTEREVEQLRIAIEFHEQQIGRLEERIEELSGFRQTALGQADRDFRICKLALKVESYQEKIENIEERISELKSESKSRRGELSLVTGETGAGTTTHGVTIAERDDNPIISNLESLEDAFHADSWGEVEAILEEHSDQQFTILIDEYAGIEDGHEFVQEMLKRRHHVILVKPHPEEFHPWTVELADSEHNITHGDRYQFSLPRRSFDSCEMPRFDFTKPPQAYPRAEFEDEDDSKDDLTQVSGVGEDEEQILNVGGYETIDDLREATQRDLANIRIGNALAARIKADVGDAEDGEPSFAEFFGLTQEEADAFKQAAEQFASGEFEDDEDELDKDLFSPDERFPPQFHLDNLESQLDYNLGQVDGFFELDWSAKCDLAKIAVEEDLDLDSTQTIVQMSLASAGDER